MRTGFDRLPLPMVLVRCRRCRLPVGQYCEDSHGEGGWRRRDEERSCTCDPPPVLPEGDELARLLKRARRIRHRADGRARVTVSR
jgi:hypothetical protein